MLHLLGVVFGALHCVSSGGGIFFFVCNSLWNKLECRRGFALGLHHLVNEIMDLFFWVVNHVNSFQEADAGDVPKAHGENLENGVVKIYRPVYIYFKEIGATVHRH